MNELKGYRSLAASVILQGIKDKDTEFFESPNGKEICDLLGIHPSKAIKAIEERRKKKEEKEHADTIAK
jgi:hypothetical protein